MSFLSSHFDSRMSIKRLKDFQIPRRQPTIQSEFEDISDDELKLKRME
jgi:hypothetical protein